MGWGLPGDTQLRAYGRFENTLGESSPPSIHLKGLVGAAAEADTAANAAASVLLPLDIVKGFPDVLDRIVSQVRAELPERYLPFVSREKLVAAQPNLHNGKSLLPLHLDEPRHDGFGVVICTCALQGGAARILLQPKDCVASGKTFSFPLARSEGYVLSGPVRNECLHGVLSDVGNENRESLNFRFGLFDVDMQSEFSSWREVEEHWEQ